ncbi:hypothetical protein TWF481_005098 [Arthrobotrys musiformis]|uniref:Uncharacterized protein n=1 Tax=Arthrobotrys musiformis TaxID=47236 RepID=A0AAV9WEM2_9PEZI
MEICFTETRILGIGIFYRLEASSEKNNRKNRKSRLTTVNLFGSIGPAIAKYPITRSPLFSAG